MVLMIYFLFYQDDLYMTTTVLISGAFSAILADYQRVDVMLFIITKVPNLNNATGEKHKGNNRESKYAFFSLLQMLKI